MITIQEISQILKETLSTPRYQHSLNVADLSKELARRHGESEEDAYLAGLCHDLAKEWSPKKFSDYVKKYALRIPGYDFIMKHSPNLLHAYVGAHVAMKKKWIKKRSIQLAIQNHTLGRVKMSKLEKIVFIADYSSEDRKYPSAKEGRTMARENLDQAYLFALSKKISWNLRKRKAIHPLALKVWNAAI